MSNGNGNGKLIRKKYKKREALLPPTPGTLSNRGRALIYNERFHCTLAFKLSLLNLSEPEMCIPLGISFETMAKWKQRYERFRKAILAGREKADANVARALYRRAVGLGVLEEEVVSRKVKDKDGNESIETKIVPKRKEYPPDVYAALKWLGNRQPAKWRVTDNMTQVQVPIQLNMDLSTLSLEDLKLAQRLGVTVTQQNPNLLNAINPLANLDDEAVNE
jgi:hypothetical protein